MRVIHLNERVRSFEERIQMTHFSENVNDIAGVVLVRLIFFVFFQFPSVGCVKTQRDNTHIVHCTLQFYALAYCGIFIFSD